MADRYYISEVDTGFVVHDANRIMPLPFLWCSRQYAKQACDDFNRRGHRAVAEYYYTHKVAGTRDIEPFRKSGKNPYKEWMEKYGDMFK